MTAAISGCASKATKPDVKDVGAAIEQANTLAANGEPAKAIELLDAAAASDPTSSKPWLKKAQLQFQGGDYSAAIQSAEQAAKRDPSDNDAKSIAIVSALRVAMSGLSELRGQASMGDNAYSEAQRMAEVLRSALGTETIVPAEDAAAATLLANPTAAPAEAKRKPVPKAPAKPAAKKPAAPAEPPASSDTNPFKDLN